MSVDLRTASTSAKKLKADLRAAFPATSFSVRVNHGTTCNVRWTDGPTVAAVESVIGRYEGKGFDGMTDSTYYKEATQSDGQSSAIGYLFCSRRLSDRFIERLIAAVAAYWGGVDYVPTVAEWRTGYAWRLVRPDLKLSWQDAVYQASSDRSIVTHPTPEEDPE